MLCALPVEYQAVRAHLTDLQQHEHPTGMRYEVGRLTDADCEVGLVQVGRGNVRAGVITERIIGLVRPDLVLCVGVAGALHDDLRLGDIVVATRVDAYQGGTAAEDFLARPQTWPAPYRLEELARSVDLHDGWRGAGQDTSAESRVHFRPIAAGEVVLDSRTSALFAQLRLHNNDAAAIDMEDAGIAQAAHLNDVAALVVRGISDRADGNKSEADRAGWQRHAADSAAAFAAALLARAATESDGQATAPRSAPGSTETPGGGSGQPRPPGSTPQLAYLRQKTAGFVGRESAFAEFRSFLDRHPSGHLIVEGLPGVGKTSLLAEEVLRNGWPAHFNIAAHLDSTSTFLHSLHAQLSERYRVRLPAPADGDDADGRYLSTLLEETAARLDPDDKLVIVVDALDEAAPGRPGTNTLFLPTVLPAGLYLLLSRRLRTAPLQIDGASTVVDLMNRSDESRGDVEKFIRNSLSRPELAARLAQVHDREQVVFSLIERSELNFMYLVYVFRDLEDGRMGPEDLRALPTGLNQYYERHLDRMLAKGGDAVLSLHTVYALAAIREPVPASLLAGVLRVTELEVVRLLADWAQFLELTPHRGAVTYGFYHQGFCDFLLQHDTVRAAGVDLGEVRSMVGHRLIASLGLDLGG
ncbi:AAA family ATPase [Catellatospora sp. KI3]|nr:AAA family ATPase [Catellatospora sp. KI3]MDI1465406.1 AAA family ATPase [Catellatospora sp. KI3]